MFSFPFEIAKQKIWVLLLDLLSALPQDWQDCWSLTAFVASPSVISLLKVYGGGSSLLFFFFFVLATELC